MATRLVFDGFCLNPHYDDLRLDFRKNFEELQ
jgi:hypothetical protein